MRVLLKEQPRLLAYIRTIVINQHLAEDLFQDISVIALTSSESIESEAHLTHWLRRTARHKALNAVQKKANQALSLSEETLNLLESEWDSADRIDLTEQTQRLEQCIDLLPEPGRRMIRMRYFDGLSGAAIAEKFNRKTAAVYMALSRLRIALRKCVEKDPARGRHDE